MPVKTPKKLRKSVSLKKSKKKVTRKTIGDNVIEFSSDADTNAAFQETANEVLSNRWFKLKPHKERYRLWAENITGGVRFAVVPAGRRSGKTELAKRFIVLKALQCLLADGWFVCAAPTRDQAKQIYWADLKRLVPKGSIEKISESELTIWLCTGVKIQVVGMDKPERVEGSPLDGIILDEYGNMKANAWTEHVRPALSTLGRHGWAWFVGVPEGRNHYYDLAKKAQGKRQTTWGYYHWRAADILDPGEIKAARQDMDELSFEQEYGGSFINFQGRAYYGFNMEVHAAESIDYDPSKALVFCFDFNIAPGVCGILQEQIYKGPNDRVSKNFTACIGEVYIKKQSNTERVCDRLIKDWRHHKGDVYLYGDSTGGNAGSAKLQGSDWDIIRAKLKPIFGKRLKYRVAKKNGPERSRVNAMNSRIKSADGVIHMLVDPDNCPNIIKDFEGVTVIEGGSGELDKDSDKALTHISDGIGYYIVGKFPLGGGNHVTVRDM